MPERRFDLSVYFNAYLKGWDRVRKVVGKTMDDVNLKHKKMQKLAVLTRRPVRELGAAMEREGYELRRLGWGYALYDKVTGRFIRGSRAQQRAISILSRSHERFKMHLLSVMFFGMQLQRTFGGLVSNALKMTGILDILSTALNMIVFTVLEPFIPIMYDILKWLLNLPKETKRMIGAFIVAISIIGSLLMLIGVLGLAFQGLKQFITDALPLDLLLGWIPGLQGFADSVEGTLTTWQLIAGILGSIGALTTAIYTSSAALDESLDGVLSGVMNFLNYLTVADVAAEEIHEEGEETVSTFGVLNKLSETLGNIWEGIQKEGFFKTMIKYLEKATDYLNKIGEISNEQAENIKTKIDEVKQKLGLEKISEDVGNIFKDISEKNLPKLSEDVNTLMQDIKNFADTTTTNTMSSIHDKMSNLIDSIREKVKRAIDDISSYIEGTNWYRVFSLPIDIINWISNKINDLKKGLERGPEISLPGIISGIISPIVSLQRGGIVPGPANRPYPAILHGGETVLPAGVRPIEVSYAPT